MPNQYIPQGTLNRLRGSVVFDLLPNLNITGPFLGKEGINSTLQGDATDTPETMTGIVTSPAPYQIANVEIELLKTQSFSNLFKQQMEISTVIGDFTIIPDSPTLSNYPVQNGSIISLQPGVLNGTRVGLILTLRGIYQINSSLYN